MKINTKQYPGLLLALAVLLEGNPNSGATTFTVTSTALSGPGSFGDALASATDGDTIDATGVSGTISPEGSQLVISHSINIIGPGPVALTIDGGGSTRVLYISGSGPVTISGFSLAHGWTTSVSGAGIYNDHATLTVTNCSLDYNMTQTTGGGIYNDHGSLTVLNCTFLQNRADLEQPYVPRGSGGGIYNNQGFLNIGNATFTGDFAGTAGGAIYNNGLAIITDSSFNGNVAYSYLSDNTISGTGGAIYNAGSLGVTRTTFQRNYSLEGAGVADNSGTLTVSDSSLVSNGNGSIDDCGGIENEPSGILVVTNSSLTGNFAGATGALHNYGGSVTVVNSLLSGNLGPFGGALFNGYGGSMTIANSTVCTNAADYPGDNILNAGSLLIVNSTITGGAISGTNISIFNSSASATLTIGSSILSAPGSGINLTNSAGTIVSLGYNLSSDSAGGFLIQASDQINTSPMLGPLQDNGGPTLTEALLPGSPAIDKGRNFSGSLYDQRGFPRIFDDFTVANAGGGDGTDAGAFELSNTNPAATTLGYPVSRGAAGFQFSLNTISGVNYSLQWSGDLKTWTTILTFRGPGGLVSIVDPNTAGNPKRFYRVSVATH